MAIYRNSTSYILWALFLNVFTLIFVLAGVELVINFIIGLFIGALIGFVVMCFCNVTSGIDEYAGKHLKDKDSNNSCGDDKKPDI